MIRIVTNRCFGGFGLSEKATAMLPEGVNEYNVKRDDPRLVAIVEELGAEANGMCAELSITEIPDGVEWQIEEYDGQEWVSEKHRTW